MESDNLFTKIRTSCEFVVQNAKHVKINDEAIKSFLEAASIGITIYIYIYILLIFLMIHCVDEITKKSALVHFPLKFDNISQEIALIR